MSFLNPIMLGALAAVAVPIVIHLLNRRRVQKIVWAAMRFLKLSVEQNQRRMKIEDIILLVLRCSLLALLALALARPAMRGSADVLGASKVTGIILLDNSMSMGMSDGSATRFDKARRAAEQALDSMGAGSSVAVWFVSDAVEPAIAEPTLDLNLARKTIRQAPLTDRSTDLLPALAKAVELLKARVGMRKELFLITDGQALGWRKFLEIRDLLERADAQAHLILVNEHEPRNLAITDLQFASGLAPVRHPLRFQVRVTNFGREEERDVRISLSIGSNAVSDEFTILRLAPGASQSVALFAKADSPGFHTVTARIAEDRLRADDVRSWTLRAIDEVRVLLVDGEPSSDARESETYFLQHALAPVSAEARANYFIRLTTAPWMDLDSFRLDDFEAVVMANVPQLQESLARKLHGFLERGGGLLIFAGDQMDIKNYNDHLFERFAILPARVASVRGNAAQDEQFFTLADKNYEHAIASIWNDPASGALSSAKFFRHVVFETNNASTAVVLSFSDGTPAVVEKSLGLGRVICFASTADTEWTDWPVRPSFVPFIHRALGAVVQGRDERLNIRVGDSFVRRLGPEFLNKDALVQRPDNLQAAESQRVSLTDGFASLRYDNTDRSGLYSVNIADPPLAETFAVQSDAAESSLDELTSAQIQSLSAVANVMTWSEDFSLKREVARGRGGLEFWLPLVVLGLAVAATESVLGQWFSRSK